MNTRTARFSLLLLPGLILGASGFAMHSLAFGPVLILASIAVVVFAFGFAAHSMQRRDLVWYAGLGGALAPLLGIPILYAALVASGATVFGVGYSGWEGVPPVLVWSLNAVIVCAIFAGLSGGAAWTGHALQRVTHRRPDTSS